MSDALTIAAPAVIQRACQSAGTSAEAIYRMVADAVAERHRDGGLLLDVGCGTGNLWGYLAAHFDRYLGADVVRYDNFPAELAFCLVDLEAQRVPLPDGHADVVTAIETIEHLENPRAFLRELVRLTRPGGWIVVTTPNQLSLLSKLTLVFKNQFNAFQDGSYPAHQTALLEVDLRRLAAEGQLTEVCIRFSEHGRIAGTARHYPRWLSRRLPRALSDNVLMIAKKPFWLAAPLPQRG